MSDGTTTPPGEGEVFKGPHQAEKAGAPGAAETPEEAAARMIQAMNPGGPIPVAPEAGNEAAKPASTEESETTKFISSVYESLPEDERSKFEENINKLGKKDISTDDIVGALSNLPFPPDTPNEYVRQVLKDAGHDEPTIKEAIDRRDEWIAKESDLVDEPEMEQKDKDTLVQAKEKANRILGDTKADITEAKNIEQEIEAKVERGEDATVELGKLRAIEEKHRGRIKSWFDENPGKIHRANRLLVRPGIAMMLLVMIMYLSALNVITSGAAKRVGGKG